MMSHVIDVTIAVDIIMLLGLKATHNVAHSSEVKHI